MLSQLWKHSEVAPVEVAPRTGVVVAPVNRIIETGSYAYSVVAGSHSVIGVQAAHEAGDLNLV